MTKSDKAKNIFAFLAILFGDDDDMYHKIMDFSPNYLIEKFERYCLSHRDEFDWGLHPTLRRSVFDKWCEKYKDNLVEK